MTSISIVDHWGDRAPQASKPLAIRLVAIDGFVTWVAKGVTRFYRVDVPWRAAWYVTPAEAAADLHDISVNIHESLPKGCIAELVEIP